MACQSSCLVRAAVLRNSASSLANSCSMGFRSDEYGQVEDRRAIARAVRRLGRAPGEAVQRDPDQHATGRADVGAQQLRLGAEPLQPTGRALARALDALKALLAALADRDQLGLGPALVARRMAKVCVRRAMVGREQQFRKPPPRCRR